MQVTAVAADDSGTVTQCIGIVPFQCAEKGETVVSGKTEGRTGVDLKEAGARLTKADFGTWAKMFLKLKEEFCRKTKKARGRIVRTRPQLACGKHKRFDGDRSRLGVGLMLFAVGGNIACGRPR